MKWLTVILAATLATATTNLQASTQHRCADDARQLAMSLLSHHVSPTEHTVHIDSKVSVLTPVRHPSKRNLVLDRIEVWGFVYKGHFRMRMLYLRGTKECHVVGQEVLTY
jgi:hypothetical protein